MECAGRVCPCLVSLLGRCIAQSDRRLRQSLAVAVRYRAFQRASRRRLPERRGGEENQWRLRVCGANPDSNTSNSDYPYFGFGGYLSNAFFTILSSFP